MEMYGRIHPELQEEELSSSFEKLKKEYSRPWRMASFLEKELGNVTMTDTLCEVLYRRTKEKDQKYRPIGGDKKGSRLPTSYLHHAATLNAVIAFCSSLRAIRVHPCLVPNLKVQAVLTLNYDCFLEAGATKKYNAYPFKPMALKESGETPSQLPVYHIHGYIPYGMGRRPKSRLVLTEKSYRKAYKPNDFPRKKLDDLLSRFSTLFIGISFDDELLLRGLEALAAGGGTPRHFALMKQGGPDRLLDRLTTARVSPILYACYEQIPSILGHVYKVGLPPDPRVQIESEGKSKVREAQISPDEYWELLLFNKP